MDPVAFLGKRVRKLRNKMGISQEDFADRAGLHRTYISSLEAGRRNVSLRNLVRIAIALEVTPSELLRSMPVGKQA